MENETIARTRLRIITLYHKIDDIYNIVCKRADKIKKYNRKMLVNLDEAETDEQKRLFTEKLKNVKNLRSKNNELKEHATTFKKELKDIEKKIRKKYLNKIILNDEDEKWFSSIDFQKYEHYVNQNEKLVGGQDGNT